MTMNEFGTLWFLGGIVIGAIMAHAKGEDVVPWILTALFIGPLAFLYLLVDDCIPDHRQGRVTTVAPPQVSPTPLPVPARVLPPPPPIGYVYLLSNPAMPGLVKIGQTTRRVEERVAELSAPTGIPVPFVIEATFASSDPVGDERRIHTRLALNRLLAQREFFRLEVPQAIEAITRICGSPPYYCRPERRVLPPNG